MYSSIYLTVYGIKIASWLNTRCVIEWECII